MCYSIKESLLCTWIYVSINQKYSNPLLLQLLELNILTPESCPWPGRSGRQGLTVNLNLKDLLRLLTTAPSLSWRFHHPVHVSILLWRKLLKRASTITMCMMPQSFLSNQSKWMLCCLTHSAGACLVSSMTINFNSNKVTTKLWKRNCSTDHMMFRPPWTHNAYCCTVPEDQPLLMLQTLCCYGDFIKILSIVMSLCRFQK